MFNKSIIGLTDSYKVSHHRQYQPGTETLYSYYESRGGAFPETVFFGLYPLLMEYLVGEVVKQQDIDYFAERFAKHFNDPTLFNRAGWQTIVDEYGGRLPLRIRAVPEGTVVPTSNVLLTVENTDPRFFWLTNYVETILCHLWYPCTVATLSREAKKTIAEYIDRTGSDPSLLPFKLHDFGFRGCTSREQAAIGGAAHLVNFMGTDTMPGFLLAEDYYGEAMAGFSIPAAEHSTITSWGGPDHEVEAFRNMIEQFGSAGSGLFAVVSDSYDIYNACSNLWGDKLLQQVREAPNMLVVRPDSGDVVPVVLEVLYRLGEKFGTTTNRKGFLTLDGVRVIQGDGMDLDMIREVCHAMYEHEWTIDNIAFGMGAGLLQKVNRDTCRFAFKASAITVDGYEHDVWKQPITDPGKNSKRGRLSLVRDSVSGDILTTNWYTTNDSEDLLQTVFLDGEYVGEVPTFADIRKRAEIQLPVMVEA